MGVEVLGMGSQALHILGKLSTRGTPPAQTYVNLPSPFHMSLCSYLGKFSDFHLPFPWTKQTQTPESSGALSPQSLSTFNTQNHEYKLLPRVSETCSVMRVWNSLFSKREQTLKSGDWAWWGLVGCVSSKVGRCLLGVTVKMRRDSLPYNVAFCATLTTSGD